MQGQEKLRLVVCVLFMEVSGVPAEVPARGTFTCAHCPRLAGQITPMPPGTSPPPAPYSQRQPAPPASALPGHPAALRMMCKQTTPPQEASLRTSPSQPSPRC